MLKIEKEYEKLYKDIPKDSLERLNLLLKDAKLYKSKIHVYDEIHRLVNTKWNKLLYTLYLVPKATPRPRLSMNGVFYVKGANDNKKLMKKYLKNEDIPLITTPTKFTCISYLPIPNSMNIVEKILAEMGFIYPVSKPDWDNLAKAYCDMFQGILLYDDALIVEGISKKKYSSKPRIEIIIEYLDDYDCNYNKKKFKGKVDKL